MKKTIIFFKGIYDPLVLFTEQLLNVFKEWGYEIFVYDARGEEVSKGLLLRMLKEEKRSYTVITFNNLGYNLEENGTNIWEKFEVPYIDILMDHPFHFEKPLQNMPQTAILLCTDRNHVKYIRRYHKNIKQVDFLAHAGVELGTKHKPLRDRKIDVLYAGALPIYTVGKMIPDLTEMYGLDLQNLMQEVLRELQKQRQQRTQKKMRLKNIQKLYLGQRVN